MYVAVNVGMCIIGGVYWKLLYVAVNMGNVHCRMSVLEIGVCGCKCK